MVTAAKAWSASDAELPKPADAEGLRARREQWLAAGNRCGNPEMAEFAKSAIESDASRHILEAVFGNSPYLSHILIEDIDFAKELICSGPDAVMADLLSEIRDRSPIGSERRAELASRLRKSKRRFAAAAAMADIAGCGDVMDLAAKLSCFAASCLEASASQLLREAHDRGKIHLKDPRIPTEGSGFILLGLGKLGAFELNFSSDIDIIVLFDEDASEVEFGGHQQLFSRLARNIVELMAKRTQDGYVFRTDLRLRPDPSSTPPAVFSESRPLLLQNGRADLGTGSHDQGMAGGRRH